MGSARSRRDAVLSFYEANLKGLEFGSAVADVILVPLLALSLVGAIVIPGSTSRTIVAVFAFIDVTSTAILLVAGYAGRGPRITCANCHGSMSPMISHWTCETCGATLKPKRPAQPPSPPQSKSG